MPIQPDGTHSLFQNEYLGAFRYLTTEVRVLVCSSMYVCSRIFFGFKTVSFQFSFFPARFHFEIFHVLSILISETLRKKYTGCFFLQSSVYPAVRAQNPTRCQHDLRSPSGAHERGRRRPRPGMYGKVVEGYRTCIIPLVRMREEGLT